MKFNIVKTQNNLENLINYGFINDLMYDDNPQKIAIDQDEKYYLGVEVYKEVDENYYITMHTYDYVKDGLSGIFLLKSQENHKVVNDNKILERALKQLIKDGLVIKEDNDET